MTTTRVGNRSDRIPQVRGRLEILRRGFGEAEWERLVDQENVIVAGFLTQEVRGIVGGGPAADYKVAYVQLGTSGVPEVAGDTVITNPVEFAVTTFSYPALKSVRFEATLAAGLGNGVVFQEAGLLFSTHVLAARKTFPGMAKSGAFEWLIRWTLTWV